MMNEVFSGFDWDNVLCRGRGSTRAPLAREKGAGFTHESMSFLTEVSELIGCNDIEARGTGNTTEQIGQNDPKKISNLPEVLHQT